MDTDPHDRALEAVAQLRQALSELSLPSRKGQDVPVLAAYTDMLASIEDIVRYHRVAIDAMITGRSPNILSGFMEQMMLKEERALVALDHRDQTHSVD